MDAKAYSEEDLIALLYKVDLLKSLPKEAMAILAGSMQIISLKGGTTLFEQNEMGDALYIVIYGRLRVFKEFEQKKQIIGDICQGQVVGEIAILIDQPRTATVKAVRDSLLLELRKETFHKFLLQYAEFGNVITKACIERLVHNTKFILPGNLTKTITILPVEKNTLIHKEFAMQLVNHLSRIDSTLLLESTFINSIIKNNGKHELISWLHQQEERYRYIIYLADNINSWWTQCCLRQADRLLIVAPAEISPALGEIETEYFHTQQESSSYVELILLQSNKFITNTAKWIALRPFVNAHHHVRLPSWKGIDRIARILSGKSIGFVFNGGGAKGAAYLGFYRALLEFDIPVDYLGGTSVGGLIGAAIALGLDWNETCEKIAKWSSRRSFLDYTWPFLSLFRKDSLVELTLLLVDEKMHIEDLEIPFFCISTDITNQAPYVHKKGTLWKALYASSSIPGVYPPIKSDEGYILIDGSILNNMPVDIMRTENNASKIVALHCNYVQESPLLQFDILDISTMAILKHNLARFFSSEKQPGLNFINLLQLAMFTASSQHEIKMEKESDYFLGIDTHQYGFLEFSKVGEIMQQGYEVSLNFLKKIAPELRA